MAAIYKEGSVASTADDASVADPRTGGISADRCPGHNPLILPRVLDIGLLVSLMRTYRKFSSLAEGIPTSGSYIYIDGKMRRDVRPKHAALHR